MGRTLLRFCRARQKVPHLRTTGVRETSFHLVRVSLQRRKRRCVLPPLSKIAQSLRLSRMPLGASLTSTSSNSELTQERDVPCFPKCHWMIFSLRGSLSCSFSESCGAAFALSSRWGSCGSFFTGHLCSPGRWSVTFPASTRMSPPPPLGHTFRGVHFLKYGELAPQGLKLYH